MNLQQINAIQAAANELLNQIVAAAPAGDPFETLENPAFEDERTKWRKEAMSLYVQIERLNFLISNGATPDQIEELRNRANAS